MSKNAKIAVGVIVVIVLIGGAYYWHQHMNVPATAATFTTASTTLPSGTSTTDQSLEQDTAAIDSQMKGLSSDQATVNSSVTQSQ